MIELLITVLLPGLIFGLFLFAIEYLSERYFSFHLGGKIKDIYISLIAGVSIAYFFLILLPEVTGEIHNYGLEIITFLSILIGFSFIHLSEKLILQRVELKSRRQLQIILEKEKTLQSVEHKFENILIDELKKEKWDNFTVKNIADFLSKLDDTESKLELQEKELHLKIQEHLHDDLDKIHIGTNYIYHLLIGLIIFKLLTVDFLSAFLFFLIALLKTTITNTSNRHIKFFDLDIHTKFSGSRLKKILLTSSSLAGFIIGFIFELFFPIALEIINILLSFIAGIILYTIVREVIPEEEKGKPFYFIIGLVASIIFFLLINFLMD